jgi:hypothetical protein
VDAARCPRPLLFCKTTPRRAWAEVARGHSFSFCCGGPNGNGPQGPPRFQADSVQLIEEYSGAAPGYLVPMWLFTDSTQDLRIESSALL